ncbi:MAG: 16S rRNA (cytidine(1402)-2'-O)-methyltransferase, partial [Porphyromonadaceae bacterium]|nr:16S rRNA (cytidine(1402)-2'-O)-methyltransferase [Porphyromonadaceae bacterium]
SRTMIFYESPFRLLKTLVQMSELFGAQRQVSVSREISKVHEETFSGNFDEVVAHYTHCTPRGECVIVVEGCKEEKKAKNQ